MFVWKKGKITQRFTEKQKRKREFLARRIVDVLERR